MLLKLRARLRGRRKSRSPLFVSGVNGQASVIVVVGARGGVAARAGCRPRPLEGRVPQTPSFFQTSKDGWPGGCPAGWGAGPAPLAKRLFARTSRLLPFLSTSGVRRPRADEGFEALAGFILVLRGEQTLQCEGLLDGEACELVTGLRGIERAGGVA